VREGLKRLGKVQKDTERYERIGEDGKRLGLRGAEASLRSTRSSSVKTKFDLQF